MDTVHTTGDYLSERAEDEYVSGEMQREREELKERRVEKTNLLKGAYERAGLTKAAAQKVVDGLGTVDEVLVAHTMMTRLQLIPPDDWLGEGAGEEEEGAFSLAARKGATTAASFVVFGATPLIAYYAAVGVADFSSAAFARDCIRTRPPYAVRRGAPTTNAPETSGRRRPWPRTTRRRPSACSGLRVW